MSEPPEDAALDAALRRAHADADPQAQLDLHAAITRAELFVLLESEVADDRLVPRVFDLSGGPAVLAFGSELRLGSFAGEAVAYAALPGRVLVPMLAEAEPGLSLLINPDVDHAALLAPATLRWLAQALTGPAPIEDRAIPQGFGPVSLPQAILDRLVSALERRLDGTPGLVQAVLVAVRWQGAGTTSGPAHALALSGVPQTAEAPLARSIVEALSLSGLEAGVLDVIFPPAPAMEAIAAVGLALSPAPFVAPDTQTVTPGGNPGLDPARPPILR
ncbi:MAG: SseB family protein [Paracoccaceae bacterium]